MVREVAVKSNEEPMQSLLGSYIELCKGAREVLRECFQDEDRGGHHQKAYFPLDI